MCSSDLRVRLILCSAQSMKVMRERLGRNIPQAKYSIENVRKNFELNFLGLSRARLDVGIK